MPFPKSKLETRADNACTVAFGMLNAARGQLARAEVSLVEEERQHAPNVGIANQHAIGFLAEIMSDLVEVRGDLVEKVTGEPAWRAPPRSHREMARQEVGTVRRAGDAADQEAVGQQRPTDRPRP